MPDATRLRSVIANTGCSCEIEEIERLGMLIRVPEDAILGALGALKDEGFGFMVDLFGLDTGERIDITYHLRSLGREDDVFVRVGHEYGGTLSSVWTVFPSAVFPEREAAELFGLRLSQSPNPRRLVTTAGCDPFLLKSVAVRDAEEVRRR